MPIAYWMISYFCRHQPAPAVFLAAASEATADASPELGGAGSYVHVSHFTYFVGCVVIGMILSGLRRLLSGSAVLDRGSHVIVNLIC